VALDTTNALTSSWTNVQTFGGMPAGSAQQVYVEDLLDRASWWFMKTCGTKLKSQSIGPEYYDVAGGRELRLRNAPVTAVASLYQDTSRAFATASLIDPDDYTWYEDEGIILLTNAVFLSGRRIVKITSTAGYTTIPYDLENACIELTCFLYDRYTNKRIGTKQVSNDSRSIIYISEVPKMVREIATLYSRKKMVFA